MAENIKKQYNKDGTLYRERFYDENGKLEKDRVYEKTWSGADYSEAVFLDHNRIVIRECKQDGTLVSETFGYGSPAED